MDGNGQRRGMDKKWTKKDNAPTDNFFLLPASVIVRFGPFLVRFQSIALLRANCLYAFSSGAEGWTA